MDPSYFTPIQKEYKKRRDTLVEGLRKIPGTFFHVPEGAFYVMARLPVEDAEAFCRFMLADFNWNQKTVMLTPGSGFYSTTDRGRDEVRLAYVLDSEKIEDAMEILARGLEQYTDR
jgi:aspartate aminotransferase